MKLYNLIAIIGFVLVLIGCVIQNEPLTIFGIGMIMFPVSFYIHDSHSRRREGD